MAESINAFNRTRDFNVRGTNWKVEGRSRVTEAGVRGLNCATLGEIDDTRYLGCHILLSYINKMNLLMGITRYLLDWYHFFKNVQPMLKSRNQL